MYDVDEFLIFLELLIMCGRNLSDKESLKLEYDTRKAKHP